MIDTKALREKILDLAIRGKLVPQDPNDEPASVLLERIRKQKQQMVKEGKLKAKDIKNDTIIFKGDDNLHYEQFQDGTVNCIEDEIPFEIPTTWCWSRLSSALDVRDGTHDTPSYVTDGVPLITSKNLNYGKIDYTNVKYISKDDALRINERSGVDVGDILFAMIGTIGNPSIITDNKLISIKNVALFKFTFCKELSNNFVMFYLYCAQEDMKKKTLGGLQPFVSLNFLRSYLIPMPPVNEQHKIASALNESLSIVNNIDSLKREINTASDLLKSKILDLAIRGKLVPQDPNDEPASVLLERIKAEKEELIKQGKIKRDKKESVIFKGDDNSYYEKIGNETKCIDDEILFKIPEKWEWARLSSIYEYIFAGGDKPKVFSKEQNEKCQYAIYSNGAEKNGLYGFTDIPRVIKPSITVSGRGTIGFSCVRHDPYFPIVRLISITPSSYISLEFLDFVFKRLLETGTGSSIPQLTVPMIKQKLIPVPPLKEQKKIVATVSDFFDQIKLLMKLM